MEKEKKDDEKLDLENFVDFFEQFNQFELLKIYGYLIFIGIQSFWVGNFDEDEE